MEQVLSDAAIQEIEHAVIRAMSQARPDIMTTREAAEYLRCSISTIHRMCADNEIPHFKVRGNLRFSRQDLEEHIKNLLLEGV